MTLRPLIAALLVAAGCGYGLSHVADYVPATAHTISIRTFDNHTREYGLDVRLRQSIEDEFRRRGPFRVVAEPEGDIELTGTIRRFATIPVAFSAVDEAIQYQGIMVVSIRLADRSSGRVLYENGNIQASQDFGVVSGVVITNSPHFQQGFINARDLPDLTDVELGDTRRRSAQTELLDILAQDIYLQAVEGF